MQFAATWTELDSVMLSLEVKETILDNLPHMQNINKGIR